MSFLGPVGRGLDTGLRSGHRAWQNPLPALRALGVGCLAWDFKTHALSPFTASHLLSLRIFLSVMHTTLDLQIP
jgi:hypothetical protein